MLLGRLAAGDVEAEERLAEAVVERLEQIAGREMEEGVSVVTRMRMPRN